MSAVVRVPASSANLGAGFDVLGMALDLHLEVGSGDPPAGARRVDQHHPITQAFAAMAARRPAASLTESWPPLWVRSAIPMGRGLGFSGAARVAGAALALVRGGDDPVGALRDDRTAVLAVAADLEGHGDNAAASVLGGVVAWVDGRAIPLRVGPRLAGASVVVWIPDATTSTDRSRRTLPPEVPRADVVHNLGRVAQFVLAVEHDDPGLLADATHDRIHQRERIPAVPDGALALEQGVEVGAWCAWLSGSGPTIAFMCEPAVVDAVRAALPVSGHTKVLRIATAGIELSTP